jgi:hypothetical protein
MREYKGNPVRSQARKDVLCAIGDYEIVNKNQIVKITQLSPLTINNILREFRNHKMVTCHAGGMYALSGEGKRYYYEIIEDKSYRKKDYEKRLKELGYDEESEKIKRTIIIDEENNSTQEKKE